MTSHGVTSVFPGVTDLRGYQRSWLRGDVLAGVTVAAYLIPQVMAYAGVAGLPPVAGLWAIVPAMAAYVIFGSSRQLSVGPESTTALMAATVVGPLAAGDPGRYAALAAGLALVVGVLCALAWLVRLGFVADLLSRPVLVGYMAGVAVIMIVGQLEKVTGVPVEGESMVDELRSFVGNVDQVQWPTVALSVAVLGFLVLLQWQFPRLPGPLLAVLLATLAVPLFNLSAYGITVVGEVPSGLPRPSLPDLSSGELRELVLAAIGVAVVGYTDNVLTARAFATRGGYDVDANQELLALGAANVGSGLMQGFPVSSSGSRTALGDSSGSRTQLYSLVALLGVLFVLVLGGTVLAGFPNAALGALIVYAACRLVDVPEFRRIARFRRAELVLALVTFAGVLLVGILYGVLIAIAVSVGELLSRVARPHDAILGHVEGLAGMHDVDDYPTARTIPGLVVYRYDSPLFFANAEDFRRRALEAADAAPDLRWFVLNVEANVEVDITALDAVEQLRVEMERRGVVFAMARVKQDLVDDLRAFGLAQSIGESRLYPTLPTAVAAYQAWADAQQHATADPGSPAPGP